MNKHVFKIFLVVFCRVAMSQKSGITANGITEGISVFYGTATFETPNRNFTMETR